MKWLFTFALLLAAGGCATSAPAVVMRTIPDCLDYNRAASFRVDVEMVKQERANMPDWLKVGPPRRASGHGTGIVLNDDGYILTSAHVAIEKGWISHQSVSVYVHGRHKPVRLRGIVVAIDSKLELAVIKVERHFNRHVTIAEIGELEDGESVYNVGYPFDFGEMVGRGYVMRQGHRDYDDIEYDNTILMDIPDGPGTSGSGIFSERTGKMVGVMMAYTYRRENPDAPPMVVRVAIPVERIRKFLNDNGIKYHITPGSRRACPR